MTIIERTRTISYAVKLYVVRHRVARDLDFSGPGQVSEKKIKWEKNENKIKKKIKWKEKKNGKDKKKNGKDKKKNGK